MLVHTFNKAWFDIELNRLINNEISNLCIALTQKEARDILPIIGEKTLGKHLFPKIKIRYEDLYKSYREDEAYESVLFSKGITDIMFKSWVLQKVKLDT